MNEIIRPAPKIILIRHAEKPNNDLPPLGVTIRGEHGKESLTVRGWQRAGGLANLFAPAGGFFQHPLLETPQFLYASKPVKHNGSWRPFETLMPLAEKIGVRINTDFQKNESGAMLEDALSRSGVILICWQREYMPKIANYINGNTITAPQHFPENRFDIIWVFRQKPATSKYDFRQVPQNLLKGDSEDLIELSDR